MSHAELIRTVHSLELGNYFIDISPPELGKSTSNIFIIGHKELFLNTYWYEI